MIWQVLLALGIALVADRWGLGTRAIGDRVAMLLVAFLYSRGYPADHGAGREAAGRRLGADARGDPRRRLDPTLGAASARTCWRSSAWWSGSCGSPRCCRLRASKYVGGIANYQIDSRMIWVGTFVFVMAPASCLADR
jgi:hypothetical protein